MGVAVAVEGQKRAGGAIALDMSDQPHLARATAYFVGLDMRGLRQRRQIAAEFDDVAIAVVPLLEQREILDDVVDRGHNVWASLSAGYIGAIRAFGQKRLPRRKSRDETRRVDNPRPRGGAAAAGPAHARPAGRRFDSRCHCRQSPAASWPPAWLPSWLPARSWPVWR